MYIVQRFLEKRKTMISARPRVLLTSNGIRLWRSARQSRLAHQELWVTKRISKISWLTAMKHYLKTYLIITLLLTSVTGGNTTLLNMHQSGQLTSIGNPLEKHSRKLERYSHFVNLTNHFVCKMWKMWSLRRDVLLIEMQLIPWHPDAARHSLIFITDFCTEYFPQKLVSNKDRYQERPKVLLPP